ncbi:MAG: amidase [Nitrososphaerales archaeon]
MQESTWNLGVRELASKISTGQISPESVYNQLADRIANINPQINAYISKLPYPYKIACGQLFGIPIAVKDNFRIQGVKCTAGSKILSGERPSAFDSTVVAKLKLSGAVIIGTTNLHEFASGVTNNNPFFGPCRNPWDIERIPGGSSGGSAAAVSARIAYGAIGSDTSGSVRIPAALCGVVGLKPTFGRVSKYGVIPLAESLDHVGILTRSALDSAIILREIAGRDPLDDSSSDFRVDDYTASIGQPIKGLKIGIPNTYFLEEIDQEVMDSFESFCKSLIELGAKLEDVSIEDLDIVREAWAPIRMSEAAAFHMNWYKSRPQDYGEDVLAMLKRGMGYSAVDYIISQRNKLKIMNSFARVFDSFDALITPTVPVTAPRIGETQVTIGNKVLDVYSTLGKLTLPFNVSGLPAMAIPCGLSKARLPISVQIVGAPFNEKTILRIAHNYEAKYGSLPLPPIASN